MITTTNKLQAIFTLIFFIGSSTVTPNVYANTEPVTTPAGGTQQSVPIPETTEAENETPPTPQEEAVELLSKVNSQKTALDTRGNNLTNELDNPPEQFKGTFVENIFISSSNAVKDILAAKDVQVEKARELHDIITDPNSSPNLIEARLEDLKVLESRFDPNEAYTGTPPKPNFKNYHTQIIFHEGERDSAINRGNQVLPLWEEINAEFNTLKENNDLLKVEANQLLSEIANLRSNYEKGSIVDFHLSTFEVGLTELIPAADAYLGNAEDLLNEAKLSDKPSIINNLLNQIKNEFGIRFDPAKRTTEEVNYFNDVDFYESEKELWAGIGDRLNNGLWGTARSRIDTINSVASELLTRSSNQLTTLNTLKTNQPNNTVLDTLIAEAESASAEINTQLENSASILSQIFQLQDDKEIQVLIHLFDEIDAVFAENSNLVEQLNAVDEGIAYQNMLIQAKEEAQARITAINNVATTLLTQTSEQLALLDEIKANQPENAAEIDLLIAEVQSIVAEINAHITNATNILEEINELSDLTEIQSRVSLFDAIDIALSSESNISKRLNEVDLQILSYDDLSEIIEEAGQTHASILKNSRKLLRGIRFREKAVKRAERYFPWIKNRPTFVTYKSEVLALKSDVETATTRANALMRNINNGTEVRASAEELTNIGKLFTRSKRNRVEGNFYDRLKDLRGSLKNLIRSFFPRKWRRR